MKPLKIVFDTNVYLAAVNKDGYARVQIQRARPNGSYKLYISPEIIIEIRRKLETKFRYSSTQSAEFINMILRYAVLVQPKRRIVDILQDQDDHIILECAIEAEASVIVSADRGLLKLKNFEDMTIVHPTRCYNI